MQDYEAALDQLRIAAQAVERKEDMNDFFALLNLRANLSADPVLAQPEFAEVLSRITGE